MAGLWRMRFLKTAPYGSAIGLNLRIWQKLSLNRSDFEPPQRSARIP